MSDEPLRAAAIQMSATMDKSANLETACRLVREAAAGGARLIALPELFNCLGSHQETIAQAECIPGPTSDAMSALARECEIHLLAGSLAERDEGSGEKAYNASLLFGPDGKVMGKYRKIHLFDVELEGSPPIRESRWFLPGSERCVSDTAIGKLGQSICYDLRFPELYRELSSRGADILFVPAAFTAKTGRAHWRTLLRARAIENQAFVIAPNQIGEQISGVPLYGHSMIIDPWGEVLAEAEGEEEAIVSAALDLDRLREVRSQIPALRHRRL